MVLNQLANALGRRDEVPNQELAHKLAAENDVEGIQEIVDNLGNQDLRIQNDCLKVLYEIGFIEPKLVAPYANEFLKLLGSLNNRQVWGGMIGLSTIAALRADALFPNVKTIMQAMAKGSVITVDAGVLTLAEIAAQDPNYNQSILPFLLDHLRNCRPKDLPQHSGKTFAAITSQDKSVFIQILETRLPELSARQAKRVRKVITQAEGIPNQQA